MNLKNCLCIKLWLGLGIISVIAGHIIIGCYFSNTNVAPYYFLLLLFSLLVSLLVLLSYSKILIDQSMRFVELTQSKIDYKNLESILNDYEIQKHIEEKRDTAQSELRDIEEKRDTAQSELRDIEEKRDTAQSKLRDIEKKKTSNLGTIKSVNYQYSIQNLHLVCLRFWYVMKHG